MISGVSSAAGRRLKPSNTTITPTSSRGYGTRWMSIRGGAKGQTAETDGAKSIYQPTLHTGYGRLGSGTTNMTPAMPATGY